MDRQCLRNEMRRTRLIQRLCRPIGRSNPFSFGGGGLLDGGFSEASLDLLSQVFSLDYMGAAEFEWGIVPATIQFLATEAVEGRVVSGKIDTSKGEVFYISPVSYEDGVKKIIKDIAQNEMRMELQEYCGLAEALNQSEDEFRQSRRAVGWLEVSNGFFFFIDETMFKNTKQILGIG